MDWREDGALLAVRRHGESSAIVEMFTESHGRHSGVVRGGSGRKLAPVLQPGAQLDVTWRARLEDQLGTYSVELKRSRAADIMGDRAALDGLNALCALLIFALPERQPYPRLYTQTQTVLDLLGRSELWSLAYLKWEFALLESVGLGLDLTDCVVTGVTDDLAFVSPKSGRAVSRKGAGDWADRLLPLPDFLRNGAVPDAKELLQGLHLSGYFLHNKLASDLVQRSLPGARQRLIDRLARQSG
ncbi:MAG: DNA repair protein RecO [Pseudoruegeria sp.]